MANSDKDILITPNRGSSSADPKIEYVGADTSGSDTITVETLYDGTNTTLSFEGSAGQLFSVSNDLSGTIFSVNDVSGIPSIEVEDDGTVTLAEYSGNVGIGTSSPSYKLDVSGDTNVAGNFTISGTGKVILDGSNKHIVSGSSTSATYISGGTASNQGANIVLYGQSTTTYANDLHFRTASGTIQLHYDYSTLQFNFNNNNSIYVSGDISTAGDITVSGTVDGRDVAADGTKLDGIESGATADQTAAEILTAIKTVDGAGSGLDADLLDGISSASFLRSDAADTASGTLTFTGATDFQNSLTYDLLNGPSTQTRDKIRVWSSSSYTIGMKSGYTFGSLNNDYAMSFQMNNASNRGFWWGHVDQSDAQGAMALSTNGKLTVADSIRLGYGVSDTTIPGATYKLDVNGSGNFASNVTTSGDITVSGENLYVGGNSNEAKIHLNAANAGSPQIELSDTDNDNYWTIVADDGDNNLKFHGSTTGQPAANIDSPDLEIAQGGALRNRGNLIWTAGNDGSGSGLDADTLDGIDSASFLRSDAADTFTTLSGTQINLGSQVSLQESSHRADLLAITSSTSTWGGLTVANSAGETLTSFMGDGSSFGIYDDQNNDWAILCTENGTLNLYYNGAVKLSTSSTGVYVTGNITLTGTVDGRDVAADGTKLDGIEAGATAAPDYAYVRSNFTATAGQTTFTVSYTVGYVDVYMNGIKLIIGTDVTATNGTSIVLAAGAAAGDLIETVAYETFSVANALTSSNIGSTVQGYDANTTTASNTQTLTNKNLRSTVYALTGTAFDATNGAIQTKTVSANTTFTDSLSSGDSIVLQLSGGGSYTITWPTITWVTSSGNSAPTLTASDTLVFWKVSSTLYGAYVGNSV